MKEFLKSIIKKLPVAFTKNQRYDLQTKRIIKKLCNDDSNCIDIGCHKGEIMDEILKYAPDGHHRGFEPLPFFYRYLENKYAGNKNAEILNIALSDYSGESVFRNVKSNPAYSGFKERDYPSDHEEVEEIKVKVDRLDKIVNESESVELIKIDVEGAEYGVLKGAEEILKTQKPVLIFEHGIGASNYYDTKPEELYSYLSGLDYKIYLMHDWLRKKKPLDQESFKKQYHQKLNYYFIAVVN